jgi:membrane protease YdiL (CAAX protease family)
VGFGGLLLASQIGLGMPLIDGWTKREPLWNRIPGVAGIAILAGILTPLTSVLDSTLGSFIKPYAQYLAKFDSMNVINPPAWQGLLTSFSAGITEETAYRLFVLSLLALLGSRIFRSQTGRPAPKFLWAASILSGILFGLAHLPLARQLGIPIDAIGVIRIIIHNGVPGVVYGWLFWTFGLESAMLAHASADVVLKVLMPLITQQTDTISSLMVGVAVLLVYALTILWSIRLILRDRKQFPPSSDSDAPEMEAGFSRPALRA